MYLFKKIILTLDKTRQSQGPTLLNIILEFHKISYF